MPIRSAGTSLVPYITPKTSMEFIKSEAEKGLFNQKDIIYITPQFRSDSDELEQLSQSIAKVGTNILGPKSSTLNIWSFITPESPPRDLFVHVSQTQGDAGLCDAKD